jgi:DNA repair protein SbcD/Mre11
MRIIHTADWHLGRIFYGSHLTNDQAYVLEQFVTIVNDFKPHAVVIAGDIYDRAVPPPDAVMLLDDIISRIVLDSSASVIIIAGNHDSPNRLGFGSRLLSQFGLHIVGTIPCIPKQIQIEDKHGKVTFFAIPYAEPSVVRECTGNDTVRDHTSAMNALIDSIYHNYTISPRSILCSHSFVSGGEESESERPLSVGGSASIPHTLFDAFSYVALGHLHQPQWIVPNRIHYAGSLLTYSFAESELDKSVTCLEMDPMGNVHYESIPLQPRRSVRRINGTLHQIMQESHPTVNRDDYIMVTLLDKEPILDAIGVLRRKFPNIMHLERPALHRMIDTTEHFDHRKLTDMELFSAFFSQTTGDELSDTQKDAFAEIVDYLDRKQRECSV